METEMEQNTKDKIYFIIITKINFTRIYRILKEDQ